MSKTRPRVGFEFAEVAGGHTSSMGGERCSLLVSVEFIMRLRCIDLRRCVHAGELASTDVLDDHHAPFLAKGTSTLDGSLPFWSN